MVSDFMHAVTAKYAVLREPEGHTLYWIYAWDKDEKNYNFDTSKSLSEANKLLEDMIDEGWDHAYIYWGNDREAFTNVDYVTKFPLR